MLPALKTYYEIKNISAENFNCPFYSSCSRQFPETFTTAKESYISSGYVSHKLPRIVLVSLDSGSAETDPNIKSLESVRIWEEEHENILGLNKNKHWYRTHELAYTILRNFQHDLRLEDARHFFAHINSAKCCENKPGRAQASQILFDNCRVFIPGELEILDPDIIITQGKWGKLSILGAFPELDFSAYIPTILSEVKLLKINDHPVIWIETYHPRNGKFHTTNKPHFPLYEQVIQNFFGDQISFMDKTRVDIGAIPSHKNEIKKSSNNPKRFFKKEEDSMGNRAGQKETGYLELVEYPGFPSADYPTKSDCKGYKYISMKQLCNISERNGQGRSTACNAFGGDNGDIPVHPDRQAWKWNQPGHRINKFVLISAVDKYFLEVGIIW